MDKQMEDWLVNEGFQEYRSMFSKHRINKVSMLRWSNVNCIKLISELQLTNQMLSIKLAQTISVCEQQKAKPIPAFMSLIKKMKSETLKWKFQTNFVPLQQFNSIDRLQQFIIEINNKYQKLIQEIQTQQQMVINNIKHWMEYSNKSHQLCKEYKVIIDELDLNIKKHQNDIDNAMKNIQNISNNNNDNHEIIQQVQNQLDMTKQIQNIHQQQTQLIRNKLDQVNDLKQQLVSRKVYDYQIEISEYTIQLSKLRKIEKTNELPSNGSNNNNNVSSRSSSASPTMDVFNDSPVPINDDNNNNNNNNNVLLSTPPVMEAIPSKKRKINNNVRLLTPPAKRQKLNINSNCNYQCNICKKQFNYENNLLIHQNNDHKYLCTKCEFNFKDGISLKNHEKQMHPATKTTKKKTKKKRNQKNNANDGDVSHICDVCNKGFSSGNALGGHKSGKHSIKRRYVNNTDDEDDEDDDINYYDMSTTKTRTSTRRTYCSLCDKSFVNKDDLMTHRDNIHLKCSICDKISDTKKEHDQHVKDCKNATVNQGGVRFHINDC